MSKILVAFVKVLPYEDIWILRSKGVNLDIKPIRTEADYEAAFKEIEGLWDAEPGTPEGDRFEVLFTLVEAYEDQHYPILPPDPIEAIKY